MYLVSNRSLTRRVPRPVSNRYCVRAQYSRHAWNDNDHSAAVDRATDGHGLLLVNAARPVRTKRALPSRLGADARRTAPNARAQW